MNSSLTLWSQWMKNTLLCTDKQGNFSVFLYVFLFVREKLCVVSDSITLDTQSCQIDYVFSPLCPSKQLCVSAGFASLFYNSRYGCQDIVTFMIHAFVHYWFLHCWQSLTLFYNMQKSSLALLCTLLQSLSFIL